MAVTSRTPHHPQKKHAMIAIYKFDVSFSAASEENAAYHLQSPKYVPPAPNAILSIT
jgi:hypothetical protein